MLLGDRLGHVDRVVAPIRVTCQLEQPAPVSLVDAVGRSAFPVAVDERRGTLASETLDEPAHLARGEVQKHRGLLERQVVGQ
jgi:hypothetical protein